MLPVFRGANCRAQRESANGIPTSAVVIVIPTTICCTGGDRLGRESAGADFEARTWCWDRERKICRREEGEDKRGVLHVGQRRVVFV
jgi:hypothetical protein